MYLCGAMMFNCFLSVLACQCIGADYTMTLEKKRQCEKGTEPKQLRYFLGGDIIEKVWLSWQIEANIPY